jgi:60 kDa SS-A/Ro ribonucleoprotein
MNFKYSLTNGSVRQKIVGRSFEMVANSGGGYGFKLDDFKFLERFLIMGATSGTYYISKNNHQYNNFENVISCIKQDGTRVVSEIVRISTNNLAHKNDHAIFALALVFAHGSNDAKQQAVKAFNSVVRTGTHLFMFASFIKSMRGFGKSVRAAINNWYIGRSDISFANQVTKYQNREGWSHLDVFRLAHPSFANNEAKNRISNWVVGKEVAFNTANNGEALIDAFVRVHKTESLKEVLEMISTYGLQREHVPTKFLNTKEVQEVMLPNLGGTALLRNLGNMSKSGLLGVFSDASKFVVEKLTDKEFLKSNKLHPLTILVAKKTYESGHSKLGSGTWQVNNSIVDALETAFYLSFDTIEPTGKNYLYGIDVSGSMGSLEPSTGLKYCEIAAVLAMAHLRSEANTFVGGFSSGFIDLKISKRDTLNSASSKCLMRNFEATNAAAAIDYATTHKIPADCFVMITDCEVNVGSHPTVALNNFRQKMGRQSSLIVCGLQAVPYSVADPKDLLQLEISGFSPDIPSIISGFTR